MIAANDFELKELSVKLEMYLIESKAPWLRANFSLVYHSIYKNDNYKDLKKFYNTIISKYPKLVFESAEFGSLHESALVSILKQDDLQMEESVIWDYVIMWGISRNHNLPDRLEDWSHKDYMILKTTLQQCLPLIRYFQISGSDFKIKIRPFKEILDKQLWTDLVKFHLNLDLPVKSVILPPRSVSIQRLPSRVYVSFSNIINREQAAEISSWIDHKSSTYHPAQNPYKFQLLLRGSEDGFAPRKFWDICNGHARTIVIVKVKGTNQIIGGYNPLTWDKTKFDWVTTNKSFIFSFKGSNSILSRVIDESCALWYPMDKDIYGPRFGLEEFMMKSCVADFTQDARNKCMNTCNGSYEKSIRTANNEFSIIDYEVFKIVTKT